MPKTARPGPSLLSGLPRHLATDLFVGAKPVRLAADEVLFLASDPGDGCYRVEDGLLKVTMVSRTGTERIARSAAAPSSANCRPDRRVAAVRPRSRSCAPRR